MLEARGFWCTEDKRQHITLKELKAVRLAVESFLPHLAGRNVLMHEDNHAVVHVLTTLTSRSPAMMAELRRVCHLQDSQDIRLWARYIRSAANVWADRMNRHLDNDDCQLDPVLYAELDARFGPHTIDRSALNASALNAMLPRPLQRRVARPCVRGGRRVAPGGCGLAGREQLGQRTLAPDPALVQKLRHSGAATAVR
eukprot:jgi/Tetstr1/426992/TSEL_017199.t1